MKISRGNTYTWYPVFFFVAFFLIITLPVMASVGEDCYLGRVMWLDPSKKTITVEVDSQYLCENASHGTSCGFTSIIPPGIAVTPPNITGYLAGDTFPSTFQSGDRVVAAIVGGNGGTWRGIARVTWENETSDWQASEIYGDPATLPVTLVGDYRIEYAILPDCSKCSGSVCKGLTSRVALWSGKVRVFDELLNPGHSIIYSGRNDGSSVSILYISGETLASQCSLATNDPGIQPVSSFVIHVVSPIGEQGFPTVMTYPAAEEMKPPVTFPSTPAPKNAPDGYLLSVCALMTLALALRRRSF